jgi:hypothetical protein
MLVKSGVLDLFNYKVSVKVTVQFGSLYVGLKVKIKRLTFNSQSK